MNSQVVKVWDPLVRLFHWLLVGGFFVAYFSEEDWMDWHIWAGYLIFGLIGWRVLWGFIGPAHARFSDFVYGPRRVFLYTGQVLRFTAPRYIGHNPAGGAMIILLFYCCACRLQPSVALRIMVQTLGWDR